MQYFGGDNDSPFDDDVEEQAASSSMSDHHTDHVEHAESIAPAHESVEQIEPENVVESSEHIALDSNAEELEVEPEQD